MQEELKETAQRLKNFPGNVKGEALRNHAEYIKLKEGEEGLKKLEEKMAELGFPINFQKIKSLHWINEGINSLMIVTAKEIFNWTDEDVFEMGRTAPKISFITKTAIQYYLVSVEKIAKNANKYWDKYYDFGSLEMKTFDKDRKIGIFREKGFKTHPVVCTMHAGYFKGVIELVVGENKEVDVKQTASVHEGEEYNEYLIKWN